MQQRRQDAMFHHQEEECESAASRGWINAALTVIMCPAPSQLIRALRFGDTDTSLKIGLSRDSFGKHRKIGPFIAQGFYIVAKYLKKKLWEKSTRVEIRGVIISVTHHNRRYCQDDRIKMMFAGDK